MKRAVILVHVSESVMLSILFYDLTRSYELLLRNGCCKISYIAQVYS